MEKLIPLLWRKGAQDLLLKPLYGIMDGVYHRLGLFCKSQTLKTPVREIHFRSQQAAGNQLEDISGDGGLGHTAVERYVLGGVQMGTAREKEEDTDLRRGDLPVCGRFIQQLIQQAVSLT